MKFDEFVFIVVLFGGLAFLSVVLALCEGRPRRTIVLRPTARESYISGRFEYTEIDGHEYLVWLDGRRGGLAHSPNCKCVRKDAPHEQ